MPALQAPDPQARLRRPKVLRDTETPTQEEEESCTTNNDNRKALFKAAEYCISIRSVNPNLLRQTFVRLLFIVFTGRGWLECPPEFDSKTLLGVQLREWTGEKLWLKLGAGVTANLAKSN